MAATHFNDGRRKTRRSEAIDAYFTCTLTGGRTNATAKAMDGRGGATRADVAKEHASPPSCLSRPLLSFPASQVQPS